MVLEDKDKEILIRLDGKVDNVLKILEGLPKIEERVRYLEQDTSCLPDMKKDIEKLDNKSNTWSILNSLGVFIAGIFAILKGN